MRPIRPGDEGRKGVVMAEKIVCGVSCRVVGVVQCKERWSKTQDNPATNYPSNEKPDLDACLANRRDDQSCSIPAAGDGWKFKAK